MVQRGSGRFRQVWRVPAWHKPAANRGSLKGTAACGAVWIGAVLAGRCWPWPRLPLLHLAGSPQARRLHFDAMVSNSESSNDSPL